MPLVPKPVLYAPVVASSEAMKAFWVPQYGKKMRLVAPDERLAAFFGVSNEAIVFTTPGLITPPASGRMLEKSKSDPPTKSEPSAAAMLRPALLPVMSLKVATPLVPNPATDAPLAASKAQTKVLDFGSSAATMLAAVCSRGLLSYADQSGNSSPVA